MTAKIISGKDVAQQIREELKKEVAEMKEKHNVVPGLVTILVGEDPASVSYVTAKQRTSHDLNFHSIQHLTVLPASCRFWRYVNPNRAIWNHSVRGKLME